MALNLTTIKKNGLTQVTTKRECQIAGYGVNSKFLASNPKTGRQDYYTPRTDNPADIIPAGTTLKVLSVHPAGTSYGPAHITVFSPSGRTFDVMAPDLGKLCQ
jgi:hypothetical protein